LTRETEREWLEAGKNFQRRVDEEMERERSENGGEEGAGAGNGQEAIERVREKVGTEGREGASGQRVAGGGDGEDFE
jgi:hypothetical protein